MKPKFFYISVIPFLLFTGILHSLEFPLEFHGRAWLGKYLNSDTIRYNMDASIQLYCTVIQHKNLSMYLQYRDDLDMAKQTGGVSLDPRYAHYYIIGGFDYSLTDYFFSFDFTHDCIHDIDYEVEGTPVFNCFRLQFANMDFHQRNRRFTARRFLWGIGLGFYPHWQYHGWDINAGADYKYDVTIETLFKIFKKTDWGINIVPTFKIIKGDSIYYHEHLIQFHTYYTNGTSCIGLELSYNIWNNNPIKAPDKLWLLAIYVGF